MIEERRDNSILVLGLLLAAALAFYGLWTEGNPTVVEIVELVTNEVYEFLDPKIITRVDKQVIYMTATPGPSVDSIIYGTPIPQLAAKARADVVSTLRALTPVAPTEATAPTEVVQQAPTIAPAPTQVVEHLESGAGQMPTAAPAPPEVTQQAPTVAPEPPTALPTEPPPVVPTNTPVPPPVVPTDTPIPPPPVPTNTPVPPPPVPTNTLVPPTPVPTNTPVPPPPVPTNTPVPPPPVPTNTSVPPTLVPPQLAAPREGNPEIAPTGGMATISGKIDSLESDLTLILTNGDYFASVTISDGSYVFENVPNGRYNLSVNQGGPGAGCGQIEVSVPSGHATLTYNYRFYKMQCALLP